jgi:hypothetical protein
VIAVLVPLLAALFAVGLLVLAWKFLHRPRRA